MSVVDTFNSNFEHLRNVIKRSTGLSEEERLVYIDLYESYGQLKIFELNSERLINTVQADKNLIEVKSSNNETLAKEIINSFSLREMKLSADWLYITFDKYLDGAAIGGKAEEVITAIALSKSMIVKFGLLGEYRFIGLNFYNWRWNRSNSVMISFNMMTLVSYIIAILNSFGTITVPMPGIPLKRIKAIIDEDTVKIPENFYRIKLKSRIIGKLTPDNSDDNQTFFIRRPQYATFVAGRFKYRIMIDRQPIDPDRLERLLEDPRRLIFYTESEIDPESKKAMDDRNRILLPGEWASVLKYWSKPYTANSNNGKNPLIPSIHTEV